MAVSENLKKAIEEKNIKTVRDCLLACIVIDPSMSKNFEMSFQYCLDNGIAESELYEVHDNGNLDIEATKENFSLLCGQLRTNFSKERLEKVKEIASVVYPVIEENKSKKSALSWFDRHPEVRLIIASSVGALVLGIAGGCVFKKDISNIDNEIKMVQKGVAFGIGFGSVVGAALGTAAGIVINKFLNKKQE